jgi:hypothetical protein
MAHATSLNFSGNALRISNPNNFEIKGPLIKRAFCFCIIRVIRANPC